MVVTCFKSDNPNRSDQLMVDVKCGIQEIWCEWKALEMARILGILRKETTA